MVPAMGHGNAGTRALLRSRGSLRGEHLWACPTPSPTPKKDWMGMDYIAVYEGEEQDDGLRSF